MIKRIARSIFISTFIFLTFMYVEHGNAMGTYDNETICNINALQAENGDVWSYLTAVTVSCGMHNANNLRGHLQLVAVPASMEYRSIARRAGSEDLNRFMVIVVIGTVDPQSGVFSPDSLIFDLANLKLGRSQPDDPLSDIGNGFFVLKLDVDGTFLKSSKYSNWQVGQVGYDEADKLTQFQQEYWKNYFDSGGLIGSNDNLDW